MTKHTNTPPSRDQFTLHVFPTVKKFMHKNFPSKEGIFKTEEWTTLGSLVTLCMIDKRSWKDRNFGDDDFKMQLTHQVKIQLTKEQMEFAPRLSKLMRVNSELHRLFREHMITWIRSQKSAGVSAIQACRSFLEHYNLDPDGTEYSLDTAYKTWQRSQKHDASS